MYKNIVLCLALLGVVLSFVSCSEEEYCYKHYAFEFPLEIPMQDTFQLGDTIWYSMNLPDSLWDQNGESYVNLSDYELYYDLIVSTDYAGLSENITNQFGYYYEKGSATDYAINSRQIYFESNANKVFKMGLIPHEKGAFVAEFALSSTFDIGDNLRKCGSFGHASSPITLGITNTPCVERIYRDSKVNVYKNGVLTAISAGETAQIKFVVL